MFTIALLFGVSASLDALLVGISYGIRRVRIRLWQNLAISLVTLLGTCLSVGLGQHLAAVLPSMIGAYAGSLVLIFLGLYYIVKWMREHWQSLHTRAIPNDFQTAQRDDPGSAALYQASVPFPKPVSFLKLTEVLSLSLTLSVNNLSAGFSASLAGLPLAPAAASTFICSVLFLFSGNRLGCSRWLQVAGCAAEPLSGLLLIGLGAVQLLL